MSSERGESPGLTADDVAQAGASSPGAGPSSATTEESLVPASVNTAFRIALPTFEGPLDLLLHLIREHRIDSFDIPIALITQKYLEAIKAMKELDLDIAGEFLLMAATLTHIKSRMLLPDPEPVPEEEQEQQDPRAELVKRLLEYQKYKAAAEELARQDLLEREVFTRRAQVEQVPLADGEIGLVEVSIFKLVEALHRMLKEAKPDVPHQVFIDRVSLSETITGMIERLKSEPRTSYNTLLGDTRDRQRIIITFLALLEMCKMRLIRIYQEEDGGDILVSTKDPDGLRADEFKDDYK
jgi:segregation and condensation protein A